MEFTLRELIGAIVFIVSAVGVVWKNKAAIDNIETKVVNHNKEIEQLWKFHDKLDIRLRENEKQWVEVNANINHVMSDLAEIKAYIMKEK